MNTRSTKLRCRSDYLLEEIFLALMIEIRGERYSGEREAQKLPLGISFCGNKNRPNNEERGATNDHV